MPEAFIVDALRTPVGKRGGGLAHVHPADLGAYVLKAIVDRNDIDPTAVEDVFFGCVDAIGPQAGDIALIAGGVQNMSQIPISSAMTMAEPMGFTDPFSGSEGWRARYGDQEVSQFRGAELIAEKWGLTREAMEDHRRRGSR
jgi:acetyl-CoA C-acetyltransferase